MTTGPRQRPGDGGEKGREEGGQEDGRDKDRVPSLRALRQGLRTGSGPRETGWSQRESS